MLVLYILNLLILLTIKAKGQYFCSVLCGTVGACVGTGYDKCQSNCANGFRRNTSTMYFACVAQ
jgi:hypothetical protein